MMPRAVRLWSFAGLLGLIAAACAPAPAPIVSLPTEAPPATAAMPRSGTPLPTRTLLTPGELVDYQVQAGDTLSALANHFNTSVEAIRAENPGLPAQVTTLPAGYPLRIPAYHLPLTGTPFKVLPDSEVPNGPSALEFDLRHEVLGKPGFLASASDYAFAQERRAWEVIEVVARNYSIHPRLLLTLLEHQSQALTDPFPSQDQRTYPLGYRNPRYRGLYRQLIWAAEYLNEGFYGWRSGQMREFETADGFLVRPDPWQNAGTVAVQRWFAAFLPKASFEVSIGPQGLARTYQLLWGDPFEKELAAIPANLQQPELGLPFLPGRIWDFSGGPHPSWGDRLPWGALDFAPPAAEGGCAPSDEWIAAPAAGLVTRSEMATLVLDLDSDGDEQTGWLLVFFHVAEEGRAPAGAEVSPADRLGHPSCEGGRATGTHFHLARRYNGEWLPADGPIPFVMDNWTPRAGPLPYEGTLTRGSKIVPACTCSSHENRIVYEVPEAAVP